MTKAKDRLRARGWRPVRDGSVYAVEWELRLAEGLRLVAFDYTADGAGVSAHAEQLSASTDECHVLVQASADNDFNDLATACEAVEKAMERWLVERLEALRRLK